MTLRRVLLAIVFVVGTGAWVAVVYWMTGLEVKPPAYLDIDLSDVPKGSPKFYTFQATPLALVRTTDAMLDDLQAQTSHTWNQRPIAAQRPAFFVYSLVNPADGCEVDHVPKGADRYAPARPWQGGFHDPCRFAEWDYAGRAIKQYADQDASRLQMADLDVPDFELRAHNILRITRAPKR
jgi:ubiquinol-cytochrome c reductase iron-sulfur subunit